MNIEPYLKANQVFRLKDGRGAKFIYRETESPGACPVRLIRNGLMYNYDLQGRYLGLTDSPLNVVAAMPPAVWTVGMHRCLPQQELMLRDYSFATYVGSAQKTTTANDYFVRFSDGAVHRYDHNGWGINENNENDVIAAFEVSGTAPPPRFRAYLRAMRGLLSRMETSFSSRDKDERKAEYARVAAGMAHLLAQVKE